MITWRNRPAGICRKCRELVTRLECRADSSGGVWHSRCYSRSTSLEDAYRAQLERDRAAAEAERARQREAVARILAKGDPAA